MGTLGVASGSTPPQGYVGMPTQAPPRTENGVTLSDSVMMHVGLGVEAGYDSNIFYRHNNIKGAPILRVLPFVEVTNAARGGRRPDGAFFDLSAALMYRDYMTSDSNIRQYRGWMPMLSGLVELHSNQQLSLSFGDTFARLEDPPYVAANLDRGGNEESIKRDANTAFAQLRWAPGGGRLQAIFRYSNVLDYFETEYLKFATSMWNSGLIDVSWKWLPKTALYLRSDFGFINYFNSRTVSSDPNNPNAPQGSSTKPSSIPIRAVVGLRGLISEKLAANLAIGYMTAFYSDGRSPGGFLGSFALSAEMTYRPTIISAISLGYRHEFYNSVIGNFFYSETAYASFQQIIAARVAMSLSGRYEHRTYALDNGADRVDDYVQVGANADYALRDWAFAGLGYSLVANGSDYVSAEGNVSFVKHQLFARLGLTY